MNILFFTKSKPYTCLAAQALKDAGHSIDIVCKDKQSFLESDLQIWCLKNGITVYTNDDLYKHLSNGTLCRYDLAISNTYGKKIKKEIIDYVDRRIFNVHCAPLPRYRGMFAYNWGIFQQETEWAVTAHYISEDFDTGEIIEVKRFPIDLKTITVKELEEKSQHYAYELTLKITNEFSNGGRPLGVPQQGETHYYSRKDYENLKRILPQDDADVVSRKIQACYCPPYEGAYLQCGNKRFPVMQGYEVEVDER